jgi:hypothetical protein
MEKDKSNVICMETKEAFDELDVAVDRWHNTPETLPMGNIIEKFLFLMKDDAS